MHAEHIPARLPRGLEIFTEQRHVLWSLAERKVTEAATGLLGVRDEYAPWPLTLSWEAGTWRRQLEDWARLLDDLEWEREPSRPTILTDIPRYALMFEREAQEAEAELGDAAERIAEIRQLERLGALGDDEIATSMAEESRIADADLDQIRVCREILEQIRAAR